MHEPPWGRELELELFFFSFFTFGPISARQILARQISWLLVFKHGRHCKQFSVIVHPGQVPHLFLFLYPDFLLVVPSETGRGFFLIDGSLCSSDGAREPSSLNSSRCLGRRTILPLRDFLLVVLTELLLSSPGDCWKKMTLLLVKLDKLGLKIFQ